MKKTIAFIIFMVSILSILYIPGYAMYSSSALAYLESVKSYRDIPGVTAEEIAAIERLREAGVTLSYGHLTETESFMLRDGTYAGFVYKFCDLLTGLFDMSFVPIHYDSWDELKTDFDIKVIDFMGELTPTPERMQIYQMTHAIADRTLSIYTLKNSDIISTETDVNDRVIGFLVGTITGDLIKSSYPVTFETVLIDNIDDAPEYLLSGAIDAFVMESVADPSFDNYDFITSKEFFPLVYSPVSLSTANEDFASIISVVDKYILAGGIDTLYRLYKEGHYEYIKNKLYNSFTDEERAYLADMAVNKKKVDIAAEYDNYPISFYNEKDKEFQGIAIDILSQISEFTGIEFNPLPIKGMSWADIIERLWLGEIAMVTEMQYSESRVEHYIWSDVPYVSSHYALLSKSDHPDLTPPQTVRERVGVLGGSLYEDMYNAWFPNNDNLITYGTQNEALDALENGDIDLLMVTEIMLLTQTNYREKPGYKVNISFSRTTDSLFGFNKDETILRSIIDKSQALVDVSTISRNWTNRTFDYSAKLANMRVLYIFCFAMILLLILILIMLLFLKTKKLGKDLERQTATVSTIYASIPDLIFCKDLNGVYTNCNPSFEKFAGLAEKDIIGKTVLELFKNDNELVGICNNNIDKKVISSRTTEIIEESVTYPDGAKRLLETIRTPLIQNKTIVGMMGISRDITERKAAEEAAKVAAKAKSTFLAHMSHEIRTPLNAIIGMSDIAKNSISDSEKTISSINQIISSSRHLLDILNNVLDMSKIESGKLEPVYAPFSLIEAYNEVSGIATQRCYEKNINFVTNINEMKKTVLIGDKLRINQVLINLLSNAVKFTANGGEVRFTVNILEETDKSILFRFSVLDNGIGMSPEQLLKLFKPFEQTDSSITARFGGTGLGLSISQNLVNMMGGEIKVHSKLGEGTEFYFELSLGKGDMPAEQSDNHLDSLDLTGKNILLVEDIEINRFIICEILATTNVNIQEVEDGQQAVDIFGKSPVGYYDMILMDIQMPVLNGYEATNKIRGLNRADAKQVPIIAMTANAYSEDIEKAIESGMNKHLAKPIDVDALLRTLSFFCER